jgi:4-hydroxy-tetrahydrodipicolinate reductase
MNAGERIPVAIVGAAGRMGRFAAQLLERSDAFALVASIGSREDLGARLRASEPSVALDVTRAGLGFEHGAAMLEAGVRPLIGTSGVSLEENAALDRIARELGLGGLVVPNFSLGMCLLQRAAVEAARHFASAEIVEMHHERKKDAPSGTSLDTAERMRAARGASSSEIPIHSVRLPGLYAHQIVTFGAAGESYTLRHDMSDTSAFGPGILRGLEHASKVLGVGRGIQLALGFEPIPD